jgi:serine/threonine protein kinase
LFEESDTHVGHAVGTVYYMPPEQIRGEQVDARSDIFSFCVVLYEMATGVLPFRGSTPAVTLEAILNRNPAPPVSLNSGISGGLERIISKALEKDPRLRYQTAADLSADLERLTRDLSSGSNPRHSHPVRPAWRLSLGLAVSITLTLAGTAMWYATRPARQTADLKPIKLTSNSSEMSVLSALISPDGKYLAFSDSGGIHVRLISTGEERVLPQTDGYSVLSWFPDGTRMAAAKYSGKAFRGFFWFHC